MKKVCSCLMSIALMTVLFTACGANNGADAKPFDYTGETFVQVLRDEGLIEENTVPQVSSEEQDSTVYYIAKLKDHPTVRMTYVVKKDGKISNILLIGSKAEGEKLSDDMARAAIAVTKLVDGSLDERSITAMLDQLATAGQKEYKEEVKNGVKYRIYFDSTMTMLYFTAPGEQTA